jgi:[ribosomal protein S5]-alanine N-acetyltransferase
MLSGWRGVNDFVRTVRLVPIQPGGVIQEDIGPLPAAAAGVLEATSSLYESAGHVPPWVCYIAVANDRIVGTCGFKAAPDQGRVEIAYFTFPGYEGKGVATQMARQLISIARDADSAVIVAAQTLPDRNASHRVLEKLGFVRLETLQHPEDGMVLEWRKTDRVAQPSHDG